jgi:hypothetical protein
LSNVGPDFVNLVEFEVVSLDLDSRWGLIGEGNATCGDDWDTLVYDKTRWTKIDDEVGCLYEGRSFAMARFSHKEVSNLTVHVVGAHFPQTLTNRDAYEVAIKTLRSKLRPGERLIFLADTNTEGPEAAASVPSHHGWNRTNTQMLEDLLGEKEEPRAAPLFPGCCQNDGYQWQGDRAMANFGAVSSSHVLFEDPPTWANCSVSEFHKGVSLVIEV